MVGNVAAPDSGQTPSELRGRPLRSRGCRMQLLLAARPGACRLIGTHRVALPMLCVVAVPTSRRIVGRILRRERAQ